MSKPLKGHAYHNKSNDELNYIIKDANEAAKNMRGFNDRAEAKYLDQINDAITVLRHREQENLKKYVKKVFSQD